MKEDVRHDWNVATVERYYGLPLTELIYEAQTVHRRYHDPTAVQRCTLLSIKTGGCSEDCAYCPQSSHHHTNVNSGPLLETTAVVTAARAAKAAGSTRFCMGAAWREVDDGPSFDRVLDMVRGVADLGMEVCTTLGMLTFDQARRLKNAGLTAYNHNLDTSPEFYGHIITTRTYEDRLETLASVQAAGIAVCCGGIVGMGESTRDRCGLLAQLGQLNPHPESLPINLLVRIVGTPLESGPDLDPFELVRTVATARIVAPKARVRLSAGRCSLSDETQALCFLAGANSIFSGDKLLTARNPAVDADTRLLDKLGLSITA